MGGEKKKQHPNFVKQGTEVKREKRRDAAKVKHCLEQNHGLNLLNCSPVPTKKQHFSESCTLSAPQTFLYNLDDGKELFLIEP